MGAVPQLVHLDSIAAVESANKAPALVLLVKLNAIFNAFPLETISVATVTRLVPYQRLAVQMFVLTSPVIH